MISAAKHPGLVSLKKIYCIAFFVAGCTALHAQTTGNISDSLSKKNVLLYYHSIAPAKVAHPYQRIDYTRPSDQLMSWPDFPLTATEIERRHRVADKENKVGNVIAKDIITGLLKKKTRVAVIPKF
jgi:hypothetical protein